jgi:hypothetical protein
MYTGSHMQQLQAQQQQRLAQQASSVTTTQ